MANKEVKKRIFTREAVNVDDRTSGFRGSSHASNALGDMADRRAIVKSYSNDWAIWEGVSSTLSGIMRKISEDDSEDKQEERRLRLKAEREAEDKIASLERIAADAEGVKLRTEIDQKTKAGE